MRNTKHTLAGLALVGSCLSLPTLYAPAALATEEKQPPINTHALAEQLHQSGNTRAAHDILAKRIHAEDATADDHIKLAKSLQSTGAYGEAINVLLRARKQHPEDTLVIYELGRTHIAAGQPKEAVNVMDMLTAIEPDNAMAYNAKAVAFDRAGNHFAAQEIYETALLIEPGSVPLQNNMAMSMILDHKAKDAVTILERLYKNEEENPKVRHNLALAYGLTGQKERALRLGLQDLSEKEAKENLRFYEQYSTLQKQHNPVSLLSEDDQVLIDQPHEDPVSVAQPPAPPKTPPVEQKIAYPKIVESEDDEDEDEIEADEAHEEDEDPTVYKGSKEPHKTQTATVPNVTELSPSAGGAEEKKEPPFGHNAVYSYPKKKGRF